MKRIWAIALFAGCITMVTFTSAYAETLNEAVTTLIQEHNRVQAARADLAAANERIRVSMKKWFPQANLTAWAGRENRESANALKTRLTAKELDVQISQLLWDFGESGSEIDEARLRHEASQAQLESAMQEVILEGVTAYLGLKRAEEVLKYAKQSEANIKRQTEMENTRVEKGLGYSTDVLQAKTQLLGAQARKARAEGAVTRAKNRVVAVFNRPANDISDLDMGAVPFGLLPATLDEARQTALESNPSLRDSLINVQITRERIRGERGKGYYPTLNAVLEYKSKEDVESIIGNRDEKVAKVELTFPFNLGFTSVNAVKAAQQDNVAASEKYEYNMDLITEDAFNAWSNLETARQNAGLLRDQADIVAEFLESARKEQQMGRRSLLDVLSGETALINAQSDAAAAEADIAISVFTLLKAMGKLDIGVIGG
ncbi:TolC family protein [Thermodesulfobacteriota bacterium]